MGELDKWNTDLFYNRQRAGFWDHTPHWYNYCRELWF